MSHPERDTLSLPKRDPANKDYIGQPHIKQVMDFIKMHYADKDDEGNVIDAEKREPSHRYHIGAWNTSCVNTSGKTIITFPEFLNELGTSIEIKPDIAWGARDYAQRSMVMMFLVAHGTEQTIVAEAARMTLRDMLLSLDVSDPDNARTELLQIFEYAKMFKHYHLSNFALLCLAALHPDKKSVDELRNIISTPEDIRNLRFALQLTLLHDHDVKDNVINLQRYINNNAQGDPAKNSNDT